MKTINARDDSLLTSGGMWSTMKKGKRCIVVAQGFYEWLKKAGGKEKIPHYTKRKDGQLMCFAGLWDCVRYEGITVAYASGICNAKGKAPGSDEKHYTYTIITTDSNSQLSFLHDRMPVILENGSEQIRTWLDPSRTEWSNDLQSLLKPFAGELECYPVSKEVGKVGNNSPSFIVPVASTENKNNIANFFSHSKKAAKANEVRHETTAKQTDVPNMEESQTTVAQSRAEDNAPTSIPASGPALKSGIKRGHDVNDSDEERRSKSTKAKAHIRPTASPEKPPVRQSRSATSNRSKGSPVKTGDGTQRITSFFSK